MTQTMLKIDIHTHILPRELPRFKEKFGYGGFIQLEHPDAQGDGSTATTGCRAATVGCSAKMVRDDGRFFREVESNCWDPGTRVAECDASGVGVQVLSTVPVLFSYWAKPKDGAEVAHFLNDHLAGVVADHPKRFVGLGTLPMQDPKLAIAELERCMKNGLRGVQIGSHVQHGQHGQHETDWNLDAPQVFEVFEAAADLGAAIFVHPWDMMGQEKMQKYWLPWLVGMPAEVSRAICSMIFGGVFEKLPKLRVAFAHGGGSFPGTLGRIRHGYAARPDLCAVDNPHDPQEYLGRFFVDSLTHDAEMLKHVVHLFGEDRVALGTDYPFPLGELQPGELIESIPEFGHETKAKLLGLNALEWLDAKAEDFL